MSKKLIFCIINLFIAISVVGQHNPDSLKNKLKSTDKDSCRLALNLKIANQFYKSRDLDSTLLYAQKTIDGAEKLNRPQIMAEGFELYGIVMRLQGNFDKALENLQKGRKIQKKNENTLPLARLLNEIAIVHFYKGEADKALEGYQKSLDLFRELKDTFQIANCLNNIGIIHFKEDNTVKAKDYYKQALEMYKITGRKINIAQTNNNIGIIYSRQGKFKKAKPFFEEAIQILEQKKIKMHLPSLYQNMGLVSKNLGNYHKAKDYLTQSIEIATQTGNKFNLNESRINLAGLYLEMCDSMEISGAKSRELIKQAEKYSIKALEEEKHINSNELKEDLYQILSKLYERKDQYKKALKYARKYKEISDTLYNKEKSKAIAEMEERYQDKKKQLRINQLEKEKELKNQWFISLIIGASLIFVFALILLYQNRQKRKANQLLARRNQEVTRANKALERLSIAINSSDNAIVIVNTEGRIESINKGFLSQYDVKANEENFKGKHLSETSIYHDFNKVLEKVKQSRESTTFETSHETYSGKTLHVQTTVTPIMENDIVKNYVIVETDINNLKKAEIELKRSNEIREKFLSIIAHDLKNPFLSLLSLSEIYIEDSDNLSHEEVNAFIENVYTVSKHGYDLLENLLQWSRLRSGEQELNPTSVNLPEPVLKTQELLNLSAQQKNINLINDVNDPVAIYIDEFALMTILRNLISNAIKYTPENGYVRIYYLKDDSKVTIYIKDNGVGMDKETKERLETGNNYKVQTGTKNEKGIGLGMNLARQYITSSGGQLRIQSEPGKGTTVSFSLPLS